jgi:hypothetical protein
LSTSKKIAMKGFFITVAILAGGITISYFISRNDKKDYIDRIKAENYFDVVDSVFLDPDSRMQPKAALSAGLKVSVQNDIYKQIAPGDTIFKKEGSLRFYWIHNGDTSIYYEEYNGEEVKE